MTSVPYHSVLAASFFFLNRGEKERRHTKDTEIARDKLWPFSVQDLLIFQTSLLKEKST